MKLTRSLLILVAFGMLGSMNAANAKVSSKTVLDKASLCILCTNYCKTHPNSPRCL